MSVYVLEKIIYTIMSKKVVRKNVFSKKKLKVKL